MIFHKLSASIISQDALDHEVSVLVSELCALLGKSIEAVYLFGSAVGGAAAMHPYSDIDLCVVVGSDVKIKELYGKLPRSKQIPVDWILVSKSDFENKVAQKHGVYWLIFQQGRRITLGDTGKNGKI